VSNLFAAEAVLPGHPDKLCDAIADSLVGEVSRREKRGLCGVEVSVHLSSVFVTGRLACAAAEEIDVDSAVRRVYREAGYGASWMPCPEALEVRTAVCAGPLNEGEAEFRGVADDQSIVTGYAIDSPATNYLPPEQWLVLTLMRALESLRVARPDLRLGPDGKVAILYNSESKRLDAFTTSLQQSIGGDEIELARTVRACVRDTIGTVATGWPAFCPALPERFLVNGAGNFAIGGPEGDNGLSGKKLVVDAYGPRVPIGGGALSGKDFYKADRAGAILARRVAKAVVLTGAASECRATLAIFPGDDAFRIVSLSTGGGELDSDRWEAVFDLTLMGAGDLYATAIDPVTLARYGHFLSAELPWERLRM
jgi:S-adenosylmethionine synthetase